MKVRAMLALACTGMVGCGGAVGIPVQPQMVPWLDAPVANRAQPFTLAGVPACNASQLHLDVHVANPSYVSGGPVNTSFWVIEVRNASSQPCFVGPAPDASFSVAGVPLVIRRERSLDGDIIYLAPHGTRAVAPYFDRAYGEIAVRPCTLSGVDRITVDFGPAQGSASVAPGPPGGVGTPCPVAGERYDIGLYGLDESGSVSGGSLSASQTTINAPPIVHPGEHVRFTVTIEDTTRSHSEIEGTVDTPNPTLDFQPCPTYHMELEGVPGTLHTYRLNCAQAQPIAFKGRETFAMEIDVPAGAQPGPSSLVWRIDGPVSTYETGRSYVVID